MPPSHQNHQKCHRRFRALPRIERASALGGVLLLCWILAGVLGQGASAQANEEAALGDRAAELLARAIAIRTVAGAGNEARLAHLYVETLREAGLEAVALPTPEQPDSLGRPDRNSTRAAAWGRLRGTGRARPLILLSHLDVVPARDPAWTSDPFTAQVENGYVRGRGALDAKGVSIVHLMALLELKRSGIELERDVLFLATPDEERGGTLGARYVIATHGDRLLDAEYLLTEGGGVLVDSSRRGAGTPLWGIAITEKTPCWLELTARGSAGHASVPTQDAAVGRLIAALDRVRRIETRIRVLPEVAVMFRELAEAAAPEDRPGFLELTDALASDPSFRRRFLSDPSRNALVRDTLSITVLEGADATNSLPSVARAQIDARLLPLPGRSCRNFAHELAGVINDSRVSIDELMAFPSRISSAATPLFAAIARVAQREDPGAIVVPRVIAGFTDAHHFRALGITAYGFTPRWLAPRETRGIHGPNEQISIANLERGTRVLVEILRELDAASLADPSADAP